MVDGKKSSKETSSPCRAVKKKQRAQGGDDDKDHKSQAGSRSGSCPQSRTRRSGREKMPSPTRWAGHPPSSTLWRSSSLYVTCFSFGLDPINSLTQKKLLCSKYLTFFDVKCKNVMKK